MRFFDRVQETSSTTGTGTITLAGAVNGYRTFASVLTNGDRVPYVISDGTNWEVGEGIYTGGTLSRLNIFSSSNAGALVNFALAMKVWIDVPATVVPAFGEMIARANQQIPQ